MRKEDIILLLEEDNLIEARRAINELLLKTVDKDTYLFFTVEKIVEYIEKNYMCNLKLVNVSRYVNLSQEYISKMFKQYTGLCFVDYLSYVRINSAEELLTNTNLSIKVIAGKVGFKDVGYFNKKFKEINGCTAKYFRLRTSELLKDFVYETNCGGEKERK